MTLADFPRILVVTSNNFNQVTGGGITLTNLFRGWPADRIANLHEDPTPEDDSVCRRFYRLSEEEISLVWPFSLVWRWGGRTALKVGGKESAGDVTTTLSVGGEERDIFWVRLARRVMGDGVPRKAKITEGLSQWLDRFKPEVLYGFLGSMAQIRLMGELARTLDIPLAVHIMDDWPAVLYRRGLFGPFLRQVVQREFKAILRKADLHLGICEEMCEEYERRYRVRFLPFHNALDMEAWLPVAKRDWGTGSRFVVRYVGSIVPDGQHEALRDVCEAVSILHSSGRSVEMWVHAPKHQVSYLRDNGFSLNGVHLVDPPPPGTIARLLSEADLLVLPINFDPRSARYIRLSMPTKVPAYMASGTPILVYGPPGIATVRYAERAGWGYVLSTPGLASLQKTLLWLMEDQVARERLGRQAQMLARQDHDAARICPAFQAALASIARGRLRDTAAINRQT